MSKKQQVQKVQKCTAVVSAFQAGIKDRQVATKQAEEEATEEAGDSQEKKTEEVQKEEKEEEEEQKEKEGEEGCVGPSTSQQGATTSRDECKVNQEAWSRLRDGKGVEPEELDKSHQLTPPAFVRPKRDADDDQPLEVELNVREQVAHNQDLRLSHKQEDLCICVCTACMYESVCMHTYMYVCMCVYIVRV